MGNIGNENAVRRADSLDSRTTPEEETRISKDLFGSPHKQGYMDETNMIQRAAGKTRHVCVVGAGIAGLRCADLLLKQGIKVTVLEGRNRVGGRLYQSNALGHLVDLGPNWIHGTNDNPILDLAKETKTVSMNWDGRQSVFDSQGNHMSDKDAAKNTEHVWSIIERAMQLSNAKSATIPAEKSLYNYFQEQVVEMFPSQDAEAKTQQQTVLQMAEMWGAFVGSPIQRQSLKFFWLEECIDGENLFVASTYDKVLKKIAEPALKGATMLFEHRVKRIISGEGKESGSITIELESRPSMTFDDVIMTAPLGWLKRNLDAFVPALPRRLTEAVESLGYGHLDKVYITFPTAFWNEPTTTDAASPAASRDLSKPNVTVTTAPIHQATDSSVNPAHHPGFTHWIHPVYSSETNSEAWSQEAVNLAALPEGTAHPTLLFYTFGPTSLHIAKLLSSNPQEKHNDILTSFFSPYYSRLPNYKQGSSDCIPQAVLATAWANDELAGYGSYSNFQIGLEKGDEDVETLRKGMPERGVWLAGEHCAPFVALGTVTGAYWSGEGVAKRVLKAYGLGEQE
ncbi:lysyl oxidase-like protein 2/3/4 [Alternaria panax]|uniref:Lysyl oxidase-like protein 2/3/4 n=1 Tax=Alternaria panax TaxID=48097 RepID=A0AAD4NTR7_9PLEO|nr:lysyl oxidase-like protein 2/3/4 [Alternaria panax]